MITKCLKRGVIGLVVLGVAGTFFLGGDMLSYVTSSAKSVRTAVKDSVPIEFELSRQGYARRYSAGDVCQYQIDRPGRGGSGGTEG